MTELYDILRKRLGEGITDIDFSVLTCAGVEYRMNDFVLTESTDGSDTVISGINPDISISWLFKSCEDRCLISLSCITALPITRITNLHLRYSRPELKDWRALADGLDMYKDTGIQTLSQIEGREVKCSFLGLFPDSQRKGLFITSLIPNKHRHEYTLTFSDGIAELSSVTSFPRGFTGEWCSETTWVASSKSILDSIDD